MARRKLTERAAFRKATLKQFTRDRQQLIADARKNAAKARETELVEKWRALRRLGVYDTKVNPAKSRLTKNRRAEINRKFQQVQDLAQYDEGEAYRPLHKTQEERTYTKFDDMGRVISKRKRIITRYQLDKDHFQLAKGKAKKLPPESLRTKKGALVGKAPDEKARINKAGEVELIETRGAAKTKFTRHPLSGPLEFIQFVNDVKSGKLKFDKKTGVQLINNGIPEMPYFGAAILGELIPRLERYIAGLLFHGKGGRGNFDDWANSSGLVKITRMR